jgi:glyoxylase-like metal-dependent hydrolase (beta-lactamase superfamily II)
MKTQTAPVVHRFEGQALPVNAYLVETEHGVVVVDSLLTVSDSKKLRARVESLGKPLLAVLITHAHPDHYGGLTELLAGDEVPIVATEGVDRIIRRDDEAKEAILRPMFGDEWAKERTFPNRTVRDGESVTFGGVTFRVIDLGPGESPHDSIWTLEGEGSRAFVGDLVYNRMHAYLADGHYEQWLANLERAKGMFGPDAVLCMGHGEPTSPELLDWQAAYIRTFLEAIRAADASGAGEDGANGDAVTLQVTGRMKEFLDRDDLLFLMQLSIPPIRDQVNHSGADAAPMGSDQGGW